MTSTRKRFSLIKMKTFQCLNKFFLKREYNNVIERYSENIYMIENEDCEYLL